MEPRKELETKTTLEAKRKELEAELIDMGTRLNSMTLAQARNSQKQIERDLREFIDADLSKFDPDVLKQILNIPIGDNKDTLLHLAVRGCSPSFCQFLLNNGADPNRKNSEDDTPLMVAVAYGKGWFEICKVLLDNGADPNATRQSKYTAFDFAYVSPNPDPNILALLLDPKYPMNDPYLEAKRATPLQKIRGRNESTAIKVDLASVLLDKVKEKLESKELDSQTKEKILNVLISETKYMILKKDDKMLELLIQLLPIPIRNSLLANEMIGYNGVLKYVCETFSFPCLHVLMKPNEKNEYPKIKNPQYLFKYLMAKNQNDTHIVASLELFYEQQKWLRKQEESKEDQEVQEYKLSDEDFRLLAAYLPKLKAVHTVKSNENSKNLFDGLNALKLLHMSTDVLGVIVPYLALDEQSDATYKDIEEAAKGLKELKELLTPKKGKFPDVFQPKDIFKVLRANYYKRNRDPLLNEVTKLLYEQQNQLRLKDIRDRPRLSEKKFQTLKEYYQIIKGELKVGLITGFFGPKPETKASTPTPEAKAPKSDLKVESKSRGSH